MASIDIGDWFENAGVALTTQKCGLFAKDEKPLPLRSRGVTAHVYAEHGFCEVQEQLEYVADAEDYTVAFVFPLPPRSAVYKFKAVIGDRQVVTEVKRKAAAQEDFDEAVRQGHTAVHMQKQPGASLYRVEIGNLFAMEEAIITFSYVRLLSSVAGAVEFEHQATWVPPYLKASELDAQGAPNSAVAAASPVFAHKVSYKLSYHILVHSSRGFRSIESPSPVSVSDGEDPNVRIVSLDAQVSDPSRDFTLLIELPPLPEGQSHMGQLLLQDCKRQGGKKHKTVGLATFIPRLPKPAPGHVPPAKEIIFIVDGSGSMGGAPIQQALEAALFFVKDLPAAGAITFNAAVFGSGHQMMWPSSRPSCQAAQQEAVQWLQANVHAGWGGTEVLRVLQLVYDVMPLASGASRHIIFLTDGGVSGHEEAAIYNLVQGGAGSSAAAAAAAARTTVFSLGIGHGVHRGLVEGVARWTGGLAQFVVDGEPIGRKAGLLKRCALAAEGACLTKPRLVSRSCLVRPAPNVLPPRLFADEPLHVLVEVVKAEPGACLDLSAVVPGPNGQDSPYSIPLPLDMAVRVPGDVLAVLHAMSSVGALLAGTSPLHCAGDGSRHAQQPDARRVEDAVVALAEEEGLVTPHTSAVGVLLQQDPLDPSAVKQVAVPVQVPAGRGQWKEDNWGKQAQQLGGRICFMSAVPAATPFPLGFGNLGFGQGGQAAPAPLGGGSFSAATAPFPFGAAQQSAASGGFSALAPSCFGAPPQSAAFGGSAAASAPYAFAAPQQSPAFGGISATSAPYAFAAPQHSAAFGGFSTTAAPYAFAAPQQSAAFGGFSAASAPYASAAPQQSAAFGGTPSASAPYSFAAPQQQSAAFGFTPPASAPYSFAAPQQQSAAIGFTPPAPTPYSFAAPQQQSAAFGGSSAVSAPYAFAAPQQSAPYAFAAPLQSAAPGSLFAAPAPHLPGAPLAAPQPTAAWGQPAAPWGAATSSKPILFGAAALPSPPVAFCTAAAPTTLDVATSHTLAPSVTPGPAQNAESGSGPQPQGGEQQAVSNVQLLPAQVLSLLNLRRTVDGAVPYSTEVLQALASEACKQQAPALPLAELAASLMTAPARPAALALDDAWVTLLALAYLRKHLAAEQGVWAGLEAKALEWLYGVWPSDVGRSVGAVVLAAMKLV